MGIIWKQRGNNWKESSVDHRADIAGFVDVMTELDKMARWGGDRRNTEKLTVRQLTALRVSASRSASYCFLSVWIGVPSVYAAWHLFGLTGALVVATLGFLPVVSLQYWLYERLRSGAGRIWATGANAVCQGIGISGLSFLFVGCIVAIILHVIGKQASLLWHHIHELLTWALSDVVTDTQTLDNSLTSSLHVLKIFIFEKPLDILKTLFALTALCAMFPYMVYFTVAKREAMIQRKVNNLFF